MMKFLVSVLLAALMVAAVAAEGVAVERRVASEHREHHHSRRAHDHAEDEEDALDGEGEEEAEEADSFVEHNAKASAHATAEQKQDADLVQALYKLVKQVMIASLLCFAFCSVCGRRQHSHRILLITILLSFACALPFLRGGLPLVALRHRLRRVCVSGCFEQTTGLRAGQEAVR